MKKEEKLPTSGVEFFEEEIFNPGCAPEIYYNAHDRSMVEIQPGQSKIVIRSRRVPGVSRWRGLKQEFIEE